jgi:ubiquinone/menaquinone biosynthesis C-methylase UbiE
MSVLVVCGGVGGEGTYLMNYGFTDVTVSDFSENSLSICRQLDPRLKTMKMDAESLDVADDSFDLVLVQDGLHHLSRPTLGLTEMLRVARDCVIVIEPHLGLAGRLVGTTWEYHGESKNYVFRWNYEMLNQIVRSYLLSTTALVNVNRFFDHNLRMAEFVARFPNWSRLILAKVLYSFLKIASPFGNMMVAVILK